MTDTDVLMPFGTCPGRYLKLTNPYKAIAEPLQDVDMDEGNS